jgi:hypothetical protein
VRAVLRTHPRQRPTRPEITRDHVLSGANKPPNPLVTTESEGDRPLADPVEEGRRVVTLANSREIRIKLFGGVAVALRCPVARQPALRRTYKDVDIATTRESKRSVEQFLSAIGYVADGEFNALHGRTRLLFADPLNNRPLDVILDQFTMCHSLDLRPRLALDELTLPTADLLLMKLQVFETNERDLLDAIALLIDGDVDLERVTEVLAGDWGWWRTATQVLEKVRTYAAGIDDTAIATEAADSVKRVLEHVERAPKGLRWRTRARVGERARWYELPEEVGG